MSNKEFDTKLQALARKEAGETVTDRMTRLGLSPEKPLFFIEVTDVYGGEANYSWVTRHLVRAKSVLGAIQWLSKRTGINWKFDGLRYNSTSGATCAFIEPWEEGEQVHFSLDTDLR